MMHHPRDHGQATHGIQIPELSFLHLVSSNLLWNPNHRVFPHPMIRKTSISLNLSVLLKPQFPTAVVSASDTSGFRSLNLANPIGRDLVSSIR